MCTFEHFDFVDASAYTGTALGKFDVVLLLSVTKWSIPCMCANSVNIPESPLLRCIHLVTESSRTTSNLASVGVDIDPWLVEQAKATYPNGPCTFEHFDFVDAHGSVCQRCSLGL
jgi:hypothetical protein